MIAARGYDSLNRPTPGTQESRTRLRNLGFKGLASADDRHIQGILIPLWGPSGRVSSWQARPDHPRKDYKDGKPPKVRKYEALPDRRASLTFTRSTATRSLTQPFLC